MSPPETPTPMTPDEIDRLRLVLVRLVRNLRTHSGLGVTPSQRAIMSTLTRHGPLSVSEIAAHENVRSPSVSRIVRALAEAGYVDRTTDDGDRRVTLIALTPSGEAAVEEARAGGRRWLTERARHLEADEVETLRSALPALEALLACAPRYELSDDAPTSDDDANEGRSS